MNETPAVNSGRVTRGTWIGAALLIAGAATLLALALSGRHDDGAEAPRASAFPEAPDTITLAPEQRGHVRTDRVAETDLPVRTTVPGRVALNANRVTPVFAQFSGRVARLEAEVGTSVTEGQRLGLLDSPDVVGMQADYQEALAAERAARTAAGQAERTRERAARLVEFEAIPLRELQEAELEEARAAEALRRAESAVAAARGRLLIAGFTAADLERLAGGPAAISRLVPLTAPVGGTIIERNVGLGQLVEPGGDALFEIADLATVWVLADVYEDQLAHVQAGDGVTIRTPAYPDETFSARVDWVGAIVDPDTRAIAVRCVIPNADGRLKPGMFASVVLQSSEARRALLVPASAVVATAHRRAVFVETEPGTYQERVIESANANDASGSVIVRSGLRAEERVVVEGSLLLAAQMKEAGNSR